MNFVWAFYEQHKQHLGILGDFSVTQERNIWGE
jgi:hypothetical protein